MIVSQGRLAIKPNLLILGGTTEATALCRSLADMNARATFSLAGRVARPKRQPFPTRVGGFGGVSGLKDYLRANAITHVIDATHPFANQMSSNAAQACQTLGVPLVGLVRPAWQPEAGDKWHRVPDIGAAASALDRPACRVFLAVGRMHLSVFASNPQHHYLLRLVDPPEGPLPFPNADAIIDRGPFDLDKDLALMRQHRTEFVVSKNSGGAAAKSKITAARQLDVPVIMVDRPQMPERDEVASVGAVIDWLNAHDTDLTV